MVPAKVPGDGSYATNGWNGPPWNGADYRAGFREMPVRTGAT
jgi:hypothetical protein